MKMAIRGDGLIFHRGARTIWISWLGCLRGHTWRHAWRFLMRRPDRREM